MPKPPARQEGSQHKPPETISEMDPQAAWSIKDGPKWLRDETNDLVDDTHAIIVDVEGAEDQVTVRWTVSPTNPARLGQEIVVVEAMLDRSGAAVGFRPGSLAANKSCGMAPFLAWLPERHVTPCLLVLDRKRQADGKFTRDRYDPDRDRFLCPEDQELTLRSITRATSVNR